jgi:hypothetical protein
VKTRIKTRQMPGDVSKQTKQAMLEGRHPDKKQSKSFKKDYVLSRERAVQKERTIKEIKRELE